MITALLALIQSSSVEGAANGLTTGGIIFMTLCWGIVAGFTFYCFYKVLKSGDKMN